MRSTFAQRVGSAACSTGIVALAATIGLTGVATAQDAPRPASIRTMDADGNNGVSRAEWSKFAQTFGQLDADKDNALSAAELEGLADSASLFTDLADLNRDGKLTRIEWARAIQNFARWDSNRSQSLELTELTTAAEAAVAASKGSANLPGSSRTASQPAGPTMWRGNIDGRGQIELLVNGNRIVGREPGGGGQGRSLGAGTFTMTGNGQSGNMDATYTEGPQQGQTCLGIYVLQGDRLLWCVNNRGGRPQSMATGNGSWLMTLSRVPVDPALLNQLNQ